MELYRQTVRWWCETCNTDYAFLYLAQKCCGGRVHKVERRVDCEGDCDVCFAGDCKSRKCEPSMEATLQ